jgi:hypothetical protein
MSPPAQLSIKSSHHSTRTSSKSADSCSSHSKTNTHILYAALSQDNYPSFEFCHSGLDPESSILAHGLSTTLAYSLGPRQVRGHSLAYSSTAASPDKLKYSLSVRRHSPASGGMTQVVFLGIFFGWLKGLLKRNNMLIHKECLERSE